jgi:hypothetical protein
VENRFVPIVASVREANSLQYPYHPEQPEVGGPSPASLSWQEDIVMHPPGRKLLIFIDARIAELGEDGLLEL